MKIIPTTVQYINKLFTEEYELDEEDVLEDYDREQNMED